MSEEKRQSVSQTLAGIDRQLSKGAEQFEELQRERQLCVAQLAEIDSILARLTAGGP
jgi:hypothetical protein